ncbi:SPFH domain-containing protein [Flavobacterium coralii]|uniref:SPFH domain-containing protein n=1 Tax=Flavobacterium coralii TaxID=2838017 RepID=UPI000C37BF9A|nr:SPFH domain-containing protein [Flavobacterium sp.]|tara:strand:- start:80574 stop:81509 length:936 start_codon:yes stop_codon:yes gene_type:complete
METIFYFALFPTVPLIIILLFGFYTVKQHNAIIIERFGKFRAVKKAGLHFKLPFIDQIAETFCLRVQQLDIVAESKTQENFFVDVAVSVQYIINADKVYEAYHYYRPKHKMTAYINDVLRSEIPRLCLADTFENKDTLSSKIKEVLVDNMQPHGFEIINVLTTDIEPDTHIKNIMNAVNAAELKKTAVEFEGELLRIMAVAKAEAEAEKKKLEGRGLAKHQIEIAKGYIESLEALTKAGIATPEASSLFMYNDTSTTKETKNKPAASLNADIIERIMASYKKAEKNDEEGADYKVVNFAKNDNSNIGVFSI